MALEKGFNHHFQYRLDQISKLTCDSSLPTLSFEALVDTLLALYADCKQLTTPSDPVKQFLTKYEKLVARIQSLRINPYDFEVIKTLATGAVGKVCLVKEKQKKQVYAMKVLKKTDLLTRREAAFFMEERNALVHAQSSTWLTTLYAAFQDEVHLYLVMEYASGGSLRSLLNNREDTMDEQECRFYVAEILCALEELHKLNFIHRDVKPDNCLIDASGHIKLADFGSCMRVDDTNRVTSSETVGTPDYISPEILRAQEGNVSYGQECDWWSLGIILYELLFGEVPFYAESLTQSYGKIMDHEKYFSFPDDFDVSEHVLDLMKKMICRHEIRLGKKGAHEIKAHDWFQSIKWDSLRSSQPPFIPQLSGPDDTRYFEDEEDESRKADLKQLKRQGNYSGNHLAFIGYTYLQNTLPVVHYSPTDQQVDELKRELASVMEKLSKEQKQHEATLSQLDHIQVTQDTTSLQSQVHHLESMLESETEQHLLVQSNLQKNVVDIKAELDAEKNKIKHVMERMDQVQKDKNGLELQLEEWKHKEKEYDQSLQDANKKYQQLMQQVENEGHVRLEVEKKYEALKSMVQHQKEQLDKVQADVTSKNQHVMELEKENAVLKVELDSMTSKMQQVQAALEAAKSAPSSSQDHLEQELQSSLMKLQSLTQDVSSLTKQKALVEMELAQMSKKYANQVDMAEQLQAKLQASEHKLQEQQVHMKSLVESSDKAIKKSSVMQTEMAHLVQQLRETRSNLSITSLKLSSLEKNHASLLNEVADWKIKYSTQVSKHEEFVNKEKEFDRLLNEERKSIRLAENSVKTLEAEKKELKATTTRLQERLLTLKSEHVKIQQAADVKLAQVEQSHKDAFDKLSLEHQHVVHSLNELKAKWEEDSERFAHTEHMNEQYRIQIDELTMQIKDDMTLQAKLNHRIQELEQSREDLKDDTLSPATASSLKTTSKSMQNLKADTKSTALVPPSGPLTPTKSNHSLLGSSRALKIKSVLFGNKKEDRDRALQKLQDAEELLKQDHRRQSSTSTVQSQKSKFSENPVVQLDYHPTEPLKGYIKLPKGGKIKKGWKKVFAIVRDNTLQTYEKEKDAEDPTMKPLDVIDLRSDIFHVKTVTQAELIHANAKDIDCIFKLHFAMNAASESTLTIQEEVEQDFDSLFSGVEEKIVSKRSSLKPESSSKRHTIGSSPYQKRMTQLQSMITMEEKYALGASSILAAATTENQRTLAQQQLEIFHKNIREWKAELEQLISNQQAALPGVEDQLKTQPSLEGLENLVLHQDIQDWKKELEEGLKRKYQEKEAVMKLYQSQLFKPAAPSPKSTLRQSSNTNSSRDTEAVLGTIEKDIHKLKEDLAILNSNNQPKIQHLLKSLNTHLSVNSHKGHYFKKRVTNKPMECSRCREALWLPSDGAKTIVECQICHAVCHTFCKAGFDISCRDFVVLKNVSPLYFMALDAQDRNRWISGILYYIRENERKSTYSYPGSPLHADPSYPIPPLQTSPSQRSLDDDVPLTPFINMYITSGSHPDITTTITTASNSSLGGEDKKSTNPEEKKPKRYSLGDKESLALRHTHDFKQEPPPPLPPLVNIKSTRDSHTKP